MVALSSHWTHTLGFVDGVTWLFSALVVESSCCSLDIPWFEELKACHKKNFIGAWVLGGVFFAVRILDCAFL